MYHCVIKLLLSFCVFSVIQYIGREGANHPCVVWGACFLWLVSIFAIVWSMALFISVGDILYMTGTDIVNGVVLLSGITLLPTSMQMLYAIGYNKKIDYENLLEFVAFFAILIFYIENGDRTGTRVACCPIWFCLLWSVIINFGGIVLCFQRIAICRQVTETFIKTSMKLYRVAPKHKHFIDNMQWYMKCCGLKSYRDWFVQDWYDKVRDYEWDPSENKDLSRRHTKQMDSVPLSCCKSGSCISNYLTELGTYSINTDGCAMVLYRLIITSMIVHIFIFSTVVLVQLTVITFILRRTDDERDDVDHDDNFNTYNVKHIMNAKEYFVSSSSMNAEDDESEPDDTV